MAGRLKQEPPREEDGLLVKERIREIQKEKGTTTFTIAFIKKFDEEWDTVVGRLKRAGI